MKKSSSSVSPALTKIPRPMNCFMTFRVEKQREILEQCPGANHRDISKIVAKWWRDFPDHKKEPYRIKAALAKAKHLEQYPDYKYRPQKKTFKTRPYKKRPENEFTARDFQNKHQLFSLYHDGNISESNTDCILDVKQSTKSTKACKQQQKTTEEPVVDQEQFTHISYPSGTDSNAYDTTSPGFAHNLSYESPSYGTGLLYPPVNDLMYTGGSNAPSAYSASSSPYSVGYYYTENQVYPENYGFVQPITPSYSVPSHINLFDQQLYEFDHRFMYNADASFVSECQPSSLAEYQGETNNVPSLLTTPFYYQ